MLCGLLAPRRHSVPIRVFAHHVELSEDMRLHVVEKAEHLRRIFDGMFTVRVTLEAEKERRVAEVMANVSHGAPVVTRVTTQNLLEAVDLAFHKIEAQLRKHKDKLRDHRVREEAAAAPEPEAAEPEDPAAAAPEPAAAEDAPESTGTAQAEE